MAELFKGITIKPERRPCYVNGTKAIFHQWDTVHNPFFQDDKMIYCPVTVGLLEFEDGSMAHFPIGDIEFADHSDFDTMLWEDE